VRIKLEGYRCMPAPHALYSKMLAERTASGTSLFYFILFYLPLSSFGSPTILTAELPISKIYVYSLTVLSDCTPFMQVLVKYSNV